jgi:hypothetical protein
MKTHCKRGHPRTPENVDKKGACKLCAKGQVKSWRENNRERHRELARIGSRAYRERNPGVWKERYLENTYGLSLEDYYKLLEKQGGVCAICHKPPVGERLAVDHDHVTGKVRGLLHRWCNSAIGFFEDDVQLLINAVNYLKGNIYVDTVPTES